MDRGYARPGEPVKLSFASKTLDGRPVKAAGHTRLFRMTVGEGGKVEEKEVKKWEADAGDAGEGDLEFKAPKAGQYRMAVSLTDAKGNKQGQAPKAVTK